MRFVKRKNGGVSGAASLLNVTWSEILEAKEVGLEEMEFGVEDIMEEAPLSKMDSLMERVIDSILKDEGLLPPGAHASITPTEFSWECTRDNKLLLCDYDAGFDIFDETGKNKLGGGVAYGSMWAYLDEKDNIQAVELQDMRVAIPIETVIKLKRIVEKKTT